MHEEEYKEESHDAEGEEFSHNESLSDEPGAIEDPVVPLRQPPAESSDDHVEPSRSIEGGQRSWSAAALLVGIVLVASDYAIVRLGTEYYWPLITTYFTSLMARFVVLIICLYVIERQLPETRTQARIVAALIGGSAGVISAIARYVAEQQVWTFFNLIVEPVDMVVLALLALAGARIISQQFKKQLTIRI